MIFGANSDAPAESGASGAAAAVEKKPKSDGSKRSYGFATKNLALYTDKNSEDLYKFKNLSSSYMRSSSPTREEEDKPTGTFAIQKRDSDNDDDSDEEVASSSKPEHSSKK